MVPNSYPAQNGSLLFTAVSADRPDLARLLLDHGADADRPDDDGHAPIFLAAQEGKAELARLLLGRGADPNREARSGATPLLVSVAKGHTEVAEALLEAAAGRAQLGPGVAGKLGIARIHLGAKLGSVVRWEETKKIYIKVNFLFWKMTKSLVGWLIGGTGREMAIII